MSAPDGRRPLGEAQQIFMFFYGTLKRGQSNHDEYCGGAVRVEDATVRGEIYDLPFGYPALVVPHESIHAEGTGDPAMDADEQRRLDRAQVALPEGPRVSGELFAFVDPESRLPLIDHLEGFDPTDASSHYRRVLLPARTSESSCILAWAYVVEESSGTYLPGGSWPP